MISVTSQGELIARLERAPKNLRRIVAEKMTEAMAQAYNKAILQFSNGKYSSTQEVTSGVVEQGSLIIGYIEPITEKAKVQEFGGKGYYEILPNKGKYLVFIGSKDGAKVFAKSVLHPPAQAKHYILDAMTEQAAVLERELSTILPEVFR